jgi:amino acid transporter
MIKIEERLVSAMAKQKHTPSEKWELKHAQSHSGWIISKYIILFVLIVLLGVFSGIQFYQMMMNFKASENLAWIVALGIPVFSVAFVYLFVCLPVNRENKSLYRYANKLEAELKAAKTALTEKDEELERLRDTSVEFSGKVDQ